MHVGLELNLNHGIALALLHPEGAVCLMHLTTP